MTNFYRTQNKILLPSSNILTNFIETIEDYLPGWWYTFHFTGEETFDVSMGPCNSCVDPESRYLLSIRPQGAGYDKTIRYPHAKVDLTKFIDYLLSEKDKAFANKEGTLYQRDSLSRHHSQINLENLAFGYNAFLEYLKSDKYDKKYPINQFMIGSCFLSADCSIRGIRPDGTPFDISYDFQGDGRLYDSVFTAYRDYEAMVKYGL